MTRLGNLASPLAHALAWVWVLATCAHAQNAFGLPVLPPVVEEAKTVMPADQVLSAIFFNATYDSCNFTCRNIPDHHPKFNANGTYNCPASVVRPIYTGSEQLRPFTIATNPVHTQQVKSQLVREPTKHYTTPEHRNTCARLCIPQNIGKWSRHEPFHPNTYRWEDADQFVCDSRVVLRVDDVNEVVRVFRV